MRSASYKLILAVAIGAGLLAGCGGAQAACQEQVRAYSQQIDPITAQWGTATQRADNAPPAGLAPEIENLQAIRRQADSVVAPDCARDAHSMLTQSMDMQIRGYQDTLANKPTTTVRQEFSDAARAFANFESEIRRLAGATP